VILGVELKAAYFLGSLLLEPCPQPFFCFSYFSDRVSHFFPGLASDHDPSNYASCIAGITVYTTTST
jgi:hypothetical protein